MIRVVPDKDWWIDLCNINAVPCMCPYANAHKCPRYYDSQVLLAQINAISGMPTEKVKELGAFWKNTDFSSLCDEEVSSISKDKYGGISSVSNFCPEVSFKYLGYYADYMHKYVDEIDQDSGIHRAENEKLKNDWMYTWMSVNAKFYLDCDVFHRVKVFNEENDRNFFNRLHPNIISLINRLDSCLDSNDPSGALHAASNILETMAKDIVSNPKIENESLGGFFEKFKKNSSLPPMFLDSVLEIYKLRNKSPIAAHGSLKKSELTMVDAIVIAALTKSMVEIEYRRRCL